MSDDIECWRVLCAKVCRIAGSPGDIVLRLTTAAGETNFLFTAQDFGLFTDQLDAGATSFEEERRREELN